MLDDLFESIFGHLGVYLIEQKLGFPWSCIRQMNFELNVFIWIKIGELCSWISYWIKCECGVNFTKLSGLWKISLVTKKGYLD